MDFLLKSRLREVRVGKKGVTKTLSCKFSHSYVRIFKLFGVISVFGYRVSVLAYGTECHKSQHTHLKHLPMKRLIHSAVVYKQFEHKLRATPKKSNQIEGRHTCDTEEHSRNQIEKTKIAP